MIVMKFGGTSVQDAPRMCRAVEIVLRHRRRAPVVVVSAAGATTRKLLAMGDAARSKGMAAAAVALQQIDDFHRAILAGLDLDEHEARRARAELDRYVAGIGARVDEISDRQQCTPRMEDARISFGERLSASLFAAAARSEGLKATRVDAAEVMITDDRFRRARPDRERIRRRSARNIVPLLRRGEVPVLEGFIGATRDGVPTTMGFEASDYSASLLGAALGAEEIQIWTDVPGMLTAVHGTVAEPATVPRLSFAEARELALRGAKVLHPDTVAPARENAIPVSIRSAREPDGSFTRIDEEGGGPGIKAMAIRDGRDENQVGAEDSAPAAGAGAPEVMLCPVGESISSSGRVRERIGECLGDLPFAFVAADASDLCLPLTVPERHADAAIRALHEEFFERASRIVPDRRGD